MASDMQVDGINPDDIKLLNSGIERYNPNHIQELSAYLDQQIKTNSYDKDANLALLKLIQFGLENDNPEQAYNFVFGLAPLETHPQYDTTWKVYSPIIFKLLVKAIMQMPRSDFSLMKSMINYDHHQEHRAQSTGSAGYDELVGWSIWVHELLDCCHFEKFWQEIAAVPDRVTMFKGFEESIRQYICFTIGITFQHVDSEYAMKLLGLARVGDMSLWAQKQGWVMEGDDIFCGSQHDKVKTKNITEKLELNMPGMHEVLALGITERGLPQEQSH